MRKGKVKNLHCEIEPRMRLEKERRQELQLNHQYMRRRKEDGRRRKCGSGR